MFGSGVLGARAVQLPPLHAGPHGRQWLGLRLSLPADHLLLVPTARLRGAACAHSQGDPAGNVNWLECFLCPGSYFHKVQGKVIVVHES